MDYKNPTIADLTSLIRTIQTPDEVAYIQRMAGHRLHIPELRNGLFERLTTLLQDQTAEPKTSNSIQQDGTVYDLSQWITLSEYAQRYDLKSTNIIHNWLSRGLIPSDCIVELRQLNGLKLIRCQPYKELITSNSPSQ